MNNPMDKFQFQTTNFQPNVENNLFEVANRARQNPKAFEDYVRKNNPQAYQRAIQIRNSVVNPQQVVMQMAQQRGLNHNIMRMFNM